MTLAVLLKGVNVGGHRRFRPSVLARELGAFDVVSVGAAGTFAVRDPPDEDALRAEVQRRLPFATDVLICDGGDIAGLVAADPFRDHALRPDHVPFVTLLAAPGHGPPLPFDIPEEGPWGVRVLGVQDRLVYGLYIREMKAVRHLGRLEDLFGTTATTRSWSTILKLAEVL